MSPNSPLAPVTDFLRRHAPFDQMAPAHLEFMAKRLKLAFYARDEVILGPDSGPADRFYIIKQGRVRGDTVDGADLEGAWELVAGECFPIGALLSRRPVRLVQRAVEDTFCFELDRDDFGETLQKSPVFHDFCTRRLANLLDNALRGVQASSATRVSEDSLNTPLASLIRRAPVACEPRTSAREALEQMQRERVGCMAVVDDQGHPLGIFTLHDVLARVVLAELDLSRPIHEVMTTSPITLPPTTLACEAARLMAQRGFGHIFVVEGGRLAGVLSERDIFSLQRVGLVSLSRTIAEATTVEALAGLERDVHRLVEQMLAQGASVDQLTQILTALNDSITRRVLTLALARMPPPDVPFAWLAFGSEGRVEQTLRTDQDNGIVFRVPKGGNAATIQQQFLPIARAINQDLAACGFPLCSGNIMAGNPECCLSLAQWQERFARWIEQGTPEHLLNASIFFDFRSLYGDDTLAADLHHWISGHVRENRRFLHQMAANALRNAPPLGFINNFQLSRSHTLDLKLHGTTPFVDAARILALAHGVEETHTVRRLEAAGRAGAINPADAGAWGEAYHYIQLLRLRHQRQMDEAGEQPDNYLDPDTLNELDRRILKEAFRQSRKLQSTLRLDYGL